MTVIPMDRPSREVRRPDPGRSAALRTVPIRLNPDRPRSTGTAPARPARPATGPVVQNLTATPAERAVTAAAALVDPIGLDELNALAELQTRVDRKYFVPADLFRRMIAQLAGELRVLDMDGRRTFGYESVYFDTPDFATYRAHVQRRRQRFKARTRTYTDSGLCMFEVKLVGARGETVKERVKHPEQQRAELTESAWNHLRETVGKAYHQELPAGMQATLVTTYRRTTFVTRSGDARLTCDVGFRALDLQHEVTDTGTHVLVESKSGGQGGSAADRILRELGVRPASVSKYAVAVAALHPELPSNAWHQTLRRYFTPLQDAA
jgi:VTC domain-containing protein